jgi:hypothetical protein
VLPPPPPFLFTADASTQDPGALVGVCLCLFVLRAGLVTSVVGCETDSCDTRSLHGLGVLMSEHLHGKGNVVESNGGFNINNGAPSQWVRDIVIEGNVVKASDADKALQVAPEMLVRILA